MWKVVLASFLILAPACSGYIYGRKFSDLEQKAARDRLTRQLQYLARGDMLFEFLGEGNSYKISAFVYKSVIESGNFKNDVIFGEIYERKGASSRLAVLIPGMGESESTEGSARALAEGGFDVIRFLAKIEIFDVNALGTKDRFIKNEFRDFVKAGALTLRTRYDDYLKIVSYLRAQKNYCRIGISGVSLGGISAYYLSGKHPEIFNSTVGIITGADLAGILMTSAEPNIQKIRDTIFQKFDISESEALEILNEELKTVDPLNVAHNIKPDSALLVSNYFDNVISYEFTEKLWRDSHRPKWKLMLMKIPVFWLVHSSFWLDGHYSSGLALLLPVPLFEFWGPVLFPVLPRTADSLIVEHFQRTLR